MAEKTTQTTPDPSDAQAPASPPTAAPEARAARRTVTVPVLPFAIVGSVLIAVLFFGGGVAVGVAIGDHHASRAGVIQPFTGRTGPFGGQNGFGQKDGPRFGQNGGQNGGQPGFDPNGGQNGGQPGFGQNGGQAPQPTPAPTNG